MATKRTLPATNPGGHSHCHGNKRFPWISVSFLVSSWFCELGGCDKKQGLRAFFPLGGGGAGAGKAAPKWQTAKILDLILCW